MCFRTYLKDFFFDATIETREGCDTRRQGVIAYGPREDAAELHMFLTREPEPGVRVHYASQRDIPSMMFSDYSPHA